MSKRLFVQGLGSALYTELAETLAGHSVECVPVESVDAIADLWNSRTPSAVVIFVELPGQVGNAVRQLRFRGVNGPVLVVSDKNMDVSAVMSEGAYFFIESTAPSSLIASLALRALKCWHNSVRYSDLSERHVNLLAVIGEFVETVPTPAVLLDAEGRVTRMNGAYAEMLGLYAEEIESKRFVSLHPSAVSGLVQNALDVACNAAFGEYSLPIGGEFVFRVQSVCPGHHCSGLLVRAERLANDMGTPAIFESEMLHRRIFTTAQEAMLLVDSDTLTVFDANVKACQLYGYPFENMTERPVTDFTGEERLTTRSIRSGGRVIPVRQHVRSDGSRFSAEALLSHFVTEERRCTVVFVRDVSSRLVVEEALKTGARLYRAIVEDQTELICRFKPDSELTFVNRAYARYFGMDEDAFLGKRFLPMLDEADRKNMEEWIAVVTPDAPISSFLQQVMVGENKGRWLNWTDRAIFNLKGEVTEFQAVGKDVTERKIAEDDLKLALAEKEEYRLNLEAIFRSIPDGIVTVDREMRVIATNDSVKSVCSIDLAGGDGLCMRDLVHCKSSPCVAVLQQVLKLRKPVHGYEAECCGHGPRKRMLELNCSPLIDAEDNFAGAVLVVRDISRLADLEKLLHERHGFGSIVGRSEALQEMYHLLEQLIPYDATVLVCGESGTGKELVADALHYGGPRGREPMIKVNCSALSESLLESELFGHVRGAFTGAVRDKVGRIEAAQGGTLFLDEIADISPLIQLKLLRFLEQKEYERVGESKTRKADVRIIAASNVDLRDRVREGRFREDLFYRLNVMPVHVPALRDRQSDIPLLVDHFLAMFSREFEKSFTGVSERVMEIFMRHYWPGNVRELKHTLEHAAILCPGGEIGLTHIRADLVGVVRNGLPGVPVAVPRTDDGSGSKKVDEETLRNALNACGGNRVQAAKMLGIYRATLYRKMTKYGLD